MRKEKYPLSQFKHLVNRIKQESLLQRTRQWTGNDEIYHYYHEAIPRKEDPLYLSLSWKRKSDEPGEYIGTFKMNIEALLSKGYIRAEGEKNVRLRIYHGEDDLFYIQTKSGEPALAIGELSGN